MPGSSLFVTIFLAAYAVMSCITLITFWIDKRAARLGTWRTRERTLLIFAAALGAPGAWAGVLWLRHKSQHRAFRTWLMLITAAHLLAWAGLIYGVWVRQVL